jgi:flagellar hook-associated protein 1 FlgK
MALGGLDAALSGLRVAQQQLNTIANNVSNVSTDGYTRKILPQQTVAIDGQVIGARSNSVIRKVDLNLERDLWTQISAVNALDVKASYLNQIQQFHGPPDLEISISAEMGKLQNSFIALADSPEDGFLQRSVVEQADRMASKMRDFSSLLTQMRNDTQDQLEVAVTNANDKLQQIAELNKQIKFNLVSGKTVASLEDFRDQAVKELSQELEVSFFIRGDGVMVVQNERGVQLADERAETIFFEKNVLGPASFYPDPNNPFDNGIFVGGDPERNPVAIDITRASLNGRIGALIDLRDEILPRQQSMLDELAHKTALRFEAQGLRMFTDASGQIPLDTPPDTTTLPAPTPVEYVGFAGIIQVNDLIVANNSLVQTGTSATDVPVQSGSNEVIRRVIEFTFGEVAFQQAANNDPATQVDLRASLAAVDMQTWLGVFSDNSVTGRNDLTEFSDINSLIASGDEVFVPTSGPITTQFNLTFEEPRTATGPVTVTIDLSAIDAAFPIGAADPLGTGTINNAGQQLAAFVDQQITAAAVPPELGAGVSLNQYGQIVFSTRGNVTIDGSFAGGMAEEGLAFLGFEEGLVTPTDPYIDVQIGNDPPVRITILPGEDENDLLAKLENLGGTDEGVPGLAVDPDLTDPLGNGLLILRPGDDVTNPRFGGDLKIIGGNFTSDGTGGSGVAAGAGIVQSLFGIENPIRGVNYSSETTNASGNNVSFRRNFLGQGASVDTGIIASNNLIDYSQKLINRQTEEINSIEARATDERSFQDLLQRRLLDESGVNIEEELSNMIVVQTAFSAAARVITAIDENFQELLNAIR